MARTSSTPANINLTHPSLPAGTPGGLFQTERWDVAAGAEMQWDFPVTAGNYEVRLYFAETYNVTQVVGGRIFDVSIENNLVLDNYDIFADVGANRAVMKSFIVSANSNLDIDFTRVIENPTINAIEILTTDASPPQSTPLYRVNAGGNTVNRTPNWTGDSDQNPSSQSNVLASLSRTSSTPAAINMTHPSLPAGLPSSIFQTERWDLAGGAEMQWDFAVTAGNYEVRLYFAETYDVTQVIGGRIFDVSIENVLVLDNYDIFADAGPNRGVMKSFIVAADSNIDIDFARSLKIRRSKPSRYYRPLSNPR